MDERADAIHSNLNSFLVFLTGISSLSLDSRRLKFLEELLGSAKIPGFLIFIDTINPSVLGVRVIGVIVSFSFWADCYSYCSLSAQQ